GQRHAATEFAVCLERSGGSTTRPGGIHPEDCRNLSAKCGSQSSHSSREHTTAFRKGCSHQQLCIYVGRSETRGRQDIRFSRHGEDEHGIETGTEGNSLEFQKQRR